MPSNRRGTPLPLQQNYTEHYDPENGWTREWEWEGHEPLFVQQYAAQYQAAGCATNLSIKYGIGRLQVNDTTGAVTIDRWEVGAEQVSKSSLLNPLNITAVSNADLIIIAKAQDGELDYDTARAALTAGSGGDAARRLIDRMKLGSVDFESDNYVLRHTTNVGNRYETNISDVNKGLIYTPAQLFTEVQDSDLWIFPLPGRLVFKLQAITAPPVRSNYLWGWLKSASTEQSAAGQRVNIATLYKLDQWSTDEYETA